MGKFDNKGTVLTFAYSDKSLEHVQEAILFVDRLILLLTPQGGERNIVCYSLSGDIIWIIANPIRVHSKYETHFVGMSFQNGKLLVYSKDGVEYDVNLETGFFNKHTLVK